MLMDRSALRWLFLGLLLARPCPAGWFSESSPVPRDLLSHGQVVSLPPYIELSGLGSAPAEIVVLNAQTDASRHGSIRQVITVDTGPDVRLIVEGAWPDDVFPNPFPLAGQLQSLGPGQALDLTGPRSVWLFDRPTGLVAGSGKIDTYLDQIGDAVLLDVLTFGPVGLVRGFDDEPVLTDVDTQVIARPNGIDFQPLDGVYLSGWADMTNRLTDVAPPYELNPALLNLTWMPTQTPEPGSGLLLAAAAGALVLRRRSGRGRRGRLP